jgi:hypothetical protein
LENLDEAISLGERYLRSRPEVRSQGQGQTIVLPPAGYDGNTAYPVLIFLPCTGGTALHVFIIYAPVMEVRSFILVLPPGKGSSADHSWEGFSTCIERYEGYIDEALVWAREKCWIDEEHIILAGYSLGGDLSWALSIRTATTV